ncbi:MAG: hypothetical protein CFE25_10525 [Chitinophagaceae bacterium BSSC1]|nr:MAG: hypothetical protein CFE25_10525 [Chitinophagaceae bacterium BSSC1]
MSEFSYNHSRIDEQYQIHITEDLTRSIREQARIVMLPFFRSIAITTATSTKGVQYPIPTQLAEQIIESVFEDGQLDDDSQEEAITIAITFISKLKSWEKACLSFYFCSDDDFLDQVDEENEDSNLEDSENDEPKNLLPENGNKIQLTVNEMSQKEEIMADSLVKELIHLQDILSRDAIRNWDAASITNANENFEEYAGKGQVLIPLSLNEYQYWNSIIDTPGTEEDNDNG